MKGLFKKNIIIVLVLVLAVAGGVGLVVFSKGGLLHLRVLKSEEARLKAKNSRIQAENERLYREVLRLKNDLGYIEFLAKKRLGMVRKDEFIIEFEEDGGADKTPHAGRGR